MSNFVSNIVDKYEAEAAEYAKKYGISDSKEDTNKKWDAFRHAYSSAAMT